MVSSPADAMKTTDTALHKTAHEAKEGRQQGGLFLSAMLVLLIATWRSCGSLPQQSLISQLEREHLPGLSLEPWQHPETAMRDYGFLLERVMDEYKWDVDRSRGAIVEYLRFMQMLGEAPQMELIASSDVDLVWHEHILDTMNYGPDCIKLFGRFLNHRRARTPSEFALIPPAYQRTKGRYAERFGGSPPPRFWGAETDASSMCGGGGPPAGFQQVVPADSNGTSTGSSGATKNGRAASSNAAVPGAACPWIATMAACLLTMSVGGLQLL